MEYEEFKELLKKNNLTLKKFSELSSVGYGTCNSWSRENRKVPNWVKPFIKLYERNKQLEELKQDDCEEYKKALAKALQDNLK